MDVRAASVPDGPKFVDDQTLVTSRATFRCSFPPVRGQDEGFLIWKDRALVEKYVALAGDLDVGVVVEFGIFDGGCTVLLAELLQPQQLLAFELMTRRAADLDAYVERHRLEDVVRPFYGVDQADRSRLLEIVRSELPDRHIDVVFDDASHFLTETRASFETLFPLLRPGGLYVIEDWCELHRMAEMVLDECEPELAAVGERGTRERQLHVEEFLAGGGGRDCEALVSRLGQQATRDADRTVVADGLLDYLSADFRFDRVMTRLAFELTMAQVHSGDVISEVRIDPTWLVVRRGPAEIDADTFALASLYDDRLGLLAR